MRRLTVSRIEGLAPETARYELTDPAVAGLQLRIEPTGAKSWILRYYWRGRRVRLSLGNYPEVSQRSAHEAASNARKLLEDGIDPRRAERPSAKRRLALVPAAGKAAPTNRHSIENLAEEFMRLHIRGAQKRKRPEYVQRVLDVDVLPVWKRRDARTIKPREVVELLDGIVGRGSNVMANRVPCSCSIAQAAKSGRRTETSAIPRLRRCWPIWMTSCARRARPARFASCSSPGSAAANLPSPAWRPELSHA